MNELKAPFRRLVLAGGIVAPLLLGAAACSSLGDPSSPAAQIEFGAEMARRGYWREARFRWDQALVGRPLDPKLWNNLAVAAESLGDFAKALSCYKKALELAPGDPRIQQNYARFAEFYSNYTKGRVEETPGAKKRDEFRSGTIPGTIR